MNAKQNIFGIISLFLVTAGSLMLSYASDRILEVNSKLVEFMPKTEGSLAGPDFVEQAKKAEQLMIDFKKAQQDAILFNAIGKILFWLGILVQLYDLIRPKRTDYF